MFFARVRLRAFIFLILALSAIPALAQQTGSIQGKVTDTGGGVLPGVTVEARASVLPGPRVTVTAADGTFQLPALPPGEYTLTFTLDGMTTATRKALVQLSDITTADAALTVKGVTEAVTVTATAALIDKTSAAITSGISSEQINSVPVGQEYRDLIKLIPGVQYTQDTTRGPSAGSNGQDNVYSFDGVNVTLPLFGTLSAEPASHDIAQMTVVKGGAKAVDFHRAGGFAVDSVSKSGTNRYTGTLSWQFQNPGMAADLTTGSASRYEQTRTWTNFNAGGPIIPDRLFFFASYYRPENARDNRSNLYGELPDYSSVRNEGFGKLTVTPTRSTLLNVSLRDEHRLDKSNLFSSAQSPTSGSGNEAGLRIGTADGSWIINAMSYATFKWTHFANKTQSRPDNVSSVSPSTAVGTRLDVTSLDTQGLFTVPNQIAGQDAFNTFIQPLIDRYGYTLDGVKRGGGLVGYGSLFDKDDFFRDSVQFAYNITLSGGGMRHNVHAGYQYYKDAEHLLRNSNGWGSISVPGGRTSFQGTPIFYLAAFQQQGFGTAPPLINSEYRSQSIEVNDTINWGNWTFNVGVLASNDTLYGQGLNNDDSTLSGFVKATSLDVESRRYLMHETPFSKMIQPRLSTTWAYNGKDTVYASFARYNPVQGSLPRAASWDRNLATTIQAYFDANGVLFATDPNISSTGKLFADDLTPPTHNEWLIGTSKQITSQLTGRAYFRYRKGEHFWEDTNNNARQLFAPTAGFPNTLYIPDLAAKLTQIGTGGSVGSYVIAELDGAFTRYKEVTLESEWSNAKAKIRGSYTWSEYYGNFDQDNSTVGNDANIFIGSSNIADGAGRQMWDNRLGTLRGDRPHSIKLYGSYILPWQASMGFYAIGQSGQPWESWSYEPYRTLTTSTTDTNRFAEPAGARRTPSHAQLDLKYIQNVAFGKRYKAQMDLDLFNVFNKQTGYNPQPSVHLATFGVARNFYDPRRVQVAFRFIF
jgi:hypothetical protein